MRNEAYQTERMTFEGREFEVALYYVDDMTPSWEDDCGAGIIRTSSHFYGRPAKQPGEVIIHEDRGTYWIYDFAGTVKKAKKEGWGLCDEEEMKLGHKLGRIPTKADIIKEAVCRDLARHRGWLRQDWWYCGVCVRIIGPDGEPEGGEYDHALWRVESDGDYWKEVAGELTSEILSERREAWRAALREARERRYWACRDIITVKELS